MNQFLIYGAGALATIGGFLGWVYFEEEEVQQSFQFESNYLALAVGLQEEK